MHDLGIPDSQVHPALQSRDKLALQKKFADERVCGAKSQESSKLAQKKGCKRVKMGTGMLPKKERKYKEDHSKQQGDDGNPKGRFQLSTS
jgi:hypothetical protein